MSVGTCVFQTNTSMDSAVLARHAEDGPAGAFGQKPMVTNKALCAKCLLDGK
jgi:hypothetical protein